MLDKNGKDIKTGDTVVICNAYFKSDNGRYKVIHSAGDSDWLGKDHCLCKVGKGGDLSTSKGRTQFWPLMVTVNNREKRMEARQHNATFASIEVVKEVSCEG